jgi:adenosylcobinamide kinase/adenosylcobinamide-phosphate guanylyltransferase
MSRKIEIILITGGARSGKSSFALRKADSVQGSKAFIATARPEDPEMIDRIKRHQKERGSHWKTYECPLNLRKTLREVLQLHDVIVVDCLTLWISNLLFDTKEPERVKEEIDMVIKTLEEESKNSVKLTKKIFFVTNEVGMGIVPENILARQFRDLAGWCNQAFSSIADEVYFVISSIPIKIKGELL